MNDVEKEVYKSHPLTAKTESSDKNAQPVEISLKCTKCGGEMQSKDGNRVLCCPYCGASNMIVLDSQYEAYQNVEIAKIQSYERLSMEREKLEFEKEKYKDKRSDKNSMKMLFVMAGVALFIILIWLVLP